MTIRSSGVTSSSAASSTASGTPAASASSVPNPSSSQTCRRNGTVGDGTRATSSPNASCSPAT